MQQIERDSPAVRHLEAVTQGDSMSSHRPYSRKRHGMRMHFVYLAVLAVGLAVAGGLFSAPSEPAVAASPCAVTGHIFDECFDVGPNPSAGEVNGTDDSDPGDSNQVVDSNNNVAWTESDSPTSG